MLWFSKSISMWIICGSIENSLFELFACQTSIWITIVFFSHLSIICLAFSNLSSSCDWWWSTVGKIRWILRWELHQVSETMFGFSSWDIHLHSNCLREVLAKIVNERATASPEIAMAIFKLQLMCRKQSSIVKKRNIVDFFCCWRKVFEDFRFVYYPILKLIMMHYFYSTPVLDWFRFWIIMKTNFEMVWLHFFDKKMRMTIGDV